jgi:protein-S-isoprenylcysteine O-methyltransferase Ste14
MTASGYLLTHDEQGGRASESYGSHWRRALKAPDGYASWLGWLVGKALPLTFFTLLMVVGSVALPRQIALLAREGVHLYQALDLLRHFLMLGFLLLIMAGYLTRSQAVARARGFWERVFPTLILLGAMVGMSFLGRAEASQRPLLVAAGLLLTVPGYYVSLWALWHLRGSFAIMAEARSPVTSGPYRYIRHPLYLGEMLTMLGVCLAIGTTTALLFWAAATGMQLMRARIEEMKLAHKFADYRAYLERTQFILPGLY